MKKNGRPGCDPGTAVFYNNPVHELLKQSKL